MDVKLPPLGEGSDSGTVVNLLVKEGDQVTTGQPLLELENEKAVATIPSTAGGVVTKLHVKAGDKISVGQRIVSISAEGNDEPPAKAVPSVSASNAAAIKLQHWPNVETSQADSESTDSVEFVNPEPAAAPTIRNMARDLGIDLRRIRGSARGGRIVMTDLRAYIEHLQRRTTQLKSAAPGFATSKPALEQVDFSKWGKVTKKSLSPLRQVIARRMTENWNSIPHVTQFDDADITALLGLRKHHVETYEKRGARLTVTSFVLKTLVETLKRHPMFNSSLDEVAQEIVFKEYFHIGIAVDTEAGLIVPVIRDVDKKDLIQLSKDLEEVATRARERKVSAEDLKGGTFTISNQGGIGGAHFTPIVNKPEVAILGLGRAAARPVVVARKIEIRTMMPIGLSYDHRVIDGGAAARFITDLVKALENFSEEFVKI